MQYIADGSWRVNREQCVAPARRDKLRERLRCRTVNAQDLVVGSPERRWRAKRGHPGAKRACRCANKGLTAADVIMMLWQAGWTVLGADSRSRNSNRSMSSSKLLKAGDGLGRVAGGRGH